MEIEKMVREESVEVFKDIDIQTAIDSLVKLGKSLGLTEKEVKESIRKYLGDKNVS
jgi:hypothetical protein